MPFKIGVLQLSMEPLDETVRMAQACDAAGFDTFWLAEAYPWWRKHSMEARSSTAVTAIVARETKEITIGWGIISPYTRHPVQIAMEARVLQEAAGKVLAGGEVKYEGKAFQAYAPALKADAHVPRWRVPIYVGATGPVLQRLAGSHSDGLLTASITTPKFVEYSRKMMEEGARKAGKDSSKLDLGSVIVGSIGEDPRSAREGAREMAAMYLANKVQNIRGSADTLLECAGLSLEEIRPIANAMEEGGREAAARAVTDAMLEKVCPIAGTPAQCIARLEEYRAAGCTHILLELWGDDRLEQARLFGEKVLPHFSKK